MKTDKRISYLILVPFVAICIFFSNSQLSYGENKIKDKVPSSIKECENRLSSLEPPEGTNISSSPIYNIPLPANVKPISEVIRKGKEIPLQFAYNDLNWKRPAYKDYWHTGPYGGRWSYVPERVNYALHRIFTYIPTASISFDFEGNLGIVDESNKFNIDKSNIHQIILAVMQSDIKKIVTLDNQVIIIVEPRRTGLQVLTIPEKSINPLNKDESVIFQMVTPDGYEIDYSLMYIR